MNLWWDSMKYPPQGTGSQLSSGDHIVPVWWVTSFKMDQTLGGEYFSLVEY